MRLSNPVARNPDWSPHIAIGLGVWAAAVALTPSASGKIALLAAFTVAALAAWVVQNPTRWLALLFFCLLLTPPVPLNFGSTGVHLAPLVAILGGITGVIFAGAWRPQYFSAPLTLAFVAFIAVLLESTASAALYSGWTIGLGSLARVLLFSISLYVFLYTWGGPGSGDEDGFRTVRLLFRLGSAAAIFACADFYYQFPAPAGFGDQFVWLDEGVLRRAQGLFYEASTLGNMCAFFLVMAAVALSRRRESPPCSKLVLILGGLALSTALMFSYSRASALNVTVALGVLACLRLRRFPRALVWMTAAAAVAAVAVNVALPSFSANYWGRLLGSFSFFWQSPDAVLSGRLSHWQALLEFLEREPWHALFGIGYKTLPYSNFAGAAVVADNTYLDLLVETGVVGLTAFGVLNAMILRTGWRALHSTRKRTAFFGEWIFCFWCGELVQMFSGDLITYWRVLPIYFWVLGMAARSERNPV